MLLPKALGVITKVTGAAWFEWPLWSDPHLTQASIGKLWIKGLYQQTEAVFVRNTHHLPTVGHSSVCWQPALVSLSVSSEGLVGCSILLYNGESNQSNIHFCFTVAVRSSSAIISSSPTTSSGDVGGLSHFLLALPLSSVSVSTSDLDSGATVAALTEVASGRGRTSRCTVCSRRAQTHGEWNRPISLKLKSFRTTRGTSLFLVFQWLFV